MPKLPSSYRIPEQHLLKDELLRAEAETRDFQRHVNGKKYLAWHTLVRKVKPHLNYEVESYGFRTETVNGQELLDQVRPVVDSRRCTFINSVTQVSDDHVTPVEKLWITVIPEEAEIVNANFNVDIIDRMVAIVLKRRLDDYARTPDFDDVLASTRLAIINGLALTTAAGHNREHAVSTAGARACEAFDRAFHHARISAAGINLDDHPLFPNLAAHFDPA